jgi:outer membrane protein
VLLLHALATAAPRGAHAAEPDVGAGTPSSARPLALADAEAMALGHQPTIAQARGQRQAAEGRVEQTRAGLLPQIIVAGTYQRTTGNFAPRPGSLPTTAAAATWNSTTYNYFNVGATASQLIYDFGQASGRWRAADASRDAAAASERAIRAQTLLNVRRAYFQALAAKDLLAVADESVHNQAKHLQQTQAFVQAGMRPDIDLARVRTDLANAKVQQVNANNNHALAMTVLAQTMGVASDSRDSQFELKDVQMPPVSGEDDSSDRLVSEAIRARPEIAVLDQQERAQTLTVRALRGGYGPALGAAAGASETGTALDHLVPNWYVGLTLGWPLLQGGLTDGQVREAEGTLSSIAAQGDALRLQIRVDVEQAWLAVTASKSTIVAAGEALTNARDQLRLAERRYETGIGSAIELGDAQVAVTAAAAQAVGARFGLAIARAQLQAAVGTL